MPKRRQVSRDGCQMVTADPPLNIKPVISKLVWVRGQKEELKLLPLGVISVAIWKSDRRGGGELSSVCSPRASRTKGWRAALSPVQGRSSRLSPGQVKKKCHPKGFEKAAYQDVYPGQTISSFSVCFSISKKEVHTHSVKYFGKSTVDDC